MDEVIILSSGSEPSSPDKPKDRMGTSANPHRLVKQKTPWTLSSDSEPPTTDKDVVVVSSDSDVGTNQKVKKTKLL